ncbi:hypothetical protein [uncultured Sphingomonas sp.]|uniref:hypothetical protein n=1 Tax=uncultured Sphingomonas sp. TaxID=158754 RepID=UPI0030F8641C
MSSLSPIASPLPSVRSMPIARPQAAPVAQVTVATPAKSAATAPADDSTGSLIRTASDQLDQFDRVMEKLRNSMSAGAVTYGGRPSVGQSGQIVDRLA